MLQPALQNMADQHQLALNCDEALVRRGLALAVADQVKNDATATEHSKE